MKTPLRPMQDLDAEIRAFLAGNPTDEEIAARVARLRAEADADAAHARRLKAYGRERFRPQCIIGTQISDILDKT